jgi:osmotically-inducible protein OsmY
MRQRRVMQLRLGSKVLVPAAILSLGLAARALAQSDNGATAGESMKAAGESMEKAGADTAEGAEHAYHGAATALRDSKITLKVTGALHGDSTTQNADIEVRTTAGIVTLKGNVNSIDIATQAGQLAQNTEGVKDVNNQLKVPGTTMPD